MLYYLFCGYTKIFVGVLLFDCILMFDVEVLLKIYSNFYNFLNNIQNQERYLFIQSYN